MKKEELEKLAKAGDAEAKISLADSLSIRERLLRRKEHNTTTVTFEDDLGTFNVEVKLLSPAEQDEIAKIFSDLVSYRAESAKLPDDQKERVKLIKKGKALMNRLYSYTGNICVDPTLNKEYWEKGADFNIDVPLALISATMRESQRTAEDIRSFRKNTTRQRVIPVSNGDSQDT